jgi:PhnB protein
MLFNRSAPHARIVPVLIVSDVRAAVAWYGQVFGMVEHVKIGEAHRAQLGLLGGTAAELIVAEVRPGRRVPTADRSHQVMLKVSDLESTLARATEAGATVIDPMHDWEYGERQAAMNDPFGHQWVLTQTLVDTAPDEWGGQTIVARA